MSHAIAVALHPYTNTGCLVLSLHTCTTSTHKSNLCTHVYDKMSNAACTAVSTGLHCTCNNKYNIVLIYEGRTAAVCSLYGAGNFSLRYLIWLPSTLVPLGCVGLTSDCVGRKLVLT